MLGVYRKVIQLHKNTYVFFSDSVPLYGIQFPVLYSRSSWVICFIYSHECMLTPVLVEACFSDGKAHFRARNSNGAGPGLSRAAHTGTGWDGTSHNKGRVSVGVWSSSIEGLVAGLTIHLEENKFVPNIYEKGLKPKCKT